MIHTPGSCTTLRGSGRQRQSESRRDYFILRLRGSCVFPSCAADFASASCYGRYFVAEGIYPANAGCGSDDRCQTELTAMVRTWAGKGAWLAPEARSLYGVFEKDVTSHKYGFCRTTSIKVVGTAATQALDDHETCSTPSVLIDRSHHHNNVHLNYLRRPHCRPWGLLCPSR